MRRERHLGRTQAGGRLWAMILLLVCVYGGAGQRAMAQDVPPAEVPDQSENKTTVAAPDPSHEDPLVTMIPHAEWDRLWLSGQANFISQWHPGFHSPYQGKNSLSPQAQDATS